MTFNREKKKENDKERGWGVYTLVLVWLQVGLV